MTASHVLDAKPTLVSASPIALYTQTIIPINPKDNATHILDAKPTLVSASPMAL